MYIYALGCFFLHLAAYSQLYARRSAGILGLLYFAVLIYGFFIYPFWVPIIIFICAAFANAWLFARFLMMGLQIITPLFATIGIILLIGSIIRF